MAAKKMGPLVIREDDTAPEVLAKAIVEVADSARKLLNSRLQEDTLLILLAHETKLSKKVCKQVLTAAAGLQKFVRR